MITIPEGMGLEAFGQSDVIDSVYPKKKSRYQVLRGQIRNQAAENMDYDDVMAREGQSPMRPRVAEVQADEVPSRNRYVRPRSGGLVSTSQHTVKVTGYNQISPVSDDPDFSPVRGKVLDTELVPVKTRGEVAIYNDNPSFRARMRRAHGPRTGRPYWQSFPDNSEMEAPDKLLYDNPISKRPSWRERQEVHEDYDKEGNEEAQIRIPDKMSIGQFDLILTVASTAIQAGATGFKAYADIKRAKEERKAASQANAAQAAQSAALFQNQFAPQEAPVAPRASGGNTLAPTFAGIDWTKIAIYGGGGLALVIAGYMLLKR
jgi:hypothetical protein